MTQTNGTEKSHEKTKKVLTKCIYKLYIIYER